MKPPPVNVLMLPGVSLLEVEFDPPDHVHIRCPACKRNWTYRFEGEWSNQKAPEHADGCAIFARIQKAQQLRDRALAAPFN